MSSLRGLQRQRVHTVGRDDQVWVKDRVSGEPEQVRDELFGAPAATVDRRPILGLDPVTARRSWGWPAGGRTVCRTSGWGSRPAAATSCSRSSPYSGARRRRDRAVHELAASWPRCCSSASCAPRPPTSCGEPATRDRHTGDPLHVATGPRGRRTGARRRRASAGAAGRPSPLRKLFLAAADEIAPLYERHTDFEALCDRLDPRGAFRNAWFQERILG